MEFIPTYHFQICVDRYQANRYVKDFSCWDHFLCLACPQLTYRTGLRDIEACLRAQQPKLYHMGFGGRVSRAPLADANPAERDGWRIYADFARLYKILQIPSVTIFEKPPISEGFFNFADETENLNLGKQLNLCEF
jgi:hypothetical protein